METSPRKRLFFTLGVALQMHQSWKTGHDWTLCQLKRLELVAEPRCNVNVQSRQIKPIDESEQELNPSV